MKKYLYGTIAAILTLTSFSTYATKESVCSLIAKNNYDKLKNYIETEAPLLSVCGPGVDFDDRELSPLMFALREGANDSIINLLLDSGAEITNTKMARLCFGARPSKSDRSWLECTRGGADVKTPLEAALFQNRPAIFNRLTKEGATLENNYTIYRNISSMLQGFNEADLAYYQVKQKATQDSTEGEDNNTPTKNQFVDTLDFVFSKIEINDRPAEIKYGRIQGYPDSFFVQTLFSPKSEAAFLYVASKADAFGTFVNEIFPDKNRLWQKIKSAKEVENKYKISRSDFVRRMQLINAKDVLVDADGKNVLWYDEIGFWGPLLIEAGLDINQQDAEGNTILMTEPGMWALDAGINPNIQNKKGQTALMIAIANNRDDVQKLIKVSDLALTDQDGKTALDYAIEAKRQHIAQVLIENGAQAKDMAKVFEVFPMYEKAGRALLQKSFNASGIDENGNTLIMKALIEAANRPDFIKEAIPSLVKNNADINKFNNEGENPLHYVLKHNNDKLVNVMLENGADVNKANETGITPLMRAAESNRSLANVKDLLEKGADVNAVDKACKTVLDHARRDSEIYIILKEHGAKEQTDKKKCLASKEEKSNSSSGGSSGFGWFLFIALIAGAGFYLKDAEHRKNVQQYAQKLIKIILKREHKKRNEKK